VGKHIFNFPENIFCENYGKSYNIHSEHCISYREQTCYLKQSNAISYLGTHLAIRTNAGFKNWMGYCYIKIK
jgi:hypothetical protein